MNALLELTPSLEQELGLFSPQIILNLYIFVHLRMKLIYKTM